MGQPYDASGLPSQRALAAQFSTMPSTDGPSLAAPSSANPLSAQGVSNQVYSQVKTQLANPNADAFGSLPAVAPAAANAVTGQQADGASAENPLDMFNPVYMAAGGGIGIATGLGLEKAYRVENGQLNMAKWAGKIPGSKLGAKQLDAWVDKLIEGRGDKGKERLKRLFNRHEPDVMDKELFRDFHGSADKRFGMEGKGIFKKHFADLNLDNISKVDKHFQGVQEIHSSVNEGFFGSIKRGFSKVVNPLLGKEPPLPKVNNLLEFDAHGNLTAKSGLNAAQEEAIKLRLNKSAIDKAPDDAARETLKNKIKSRSMADTLKEANKGLESERQLFAKLKAAGFEGDFNKFTKMMRAPRSFAKGQGLIIKQYAEQFEINKSMSELGPAGRFVGRTGYYLKRAFGMESFGGESLGKAGKFIAPGILGAMTFGLAFSEAKKGETKKDKAKLFGREMLSGTVANLAGFEMIKFVTRKQGVDKALSRFAFKGLGRFSWAGTVAEMVLAMGISGWVLTPMLNKAFDGIFGKARTKEDAAKEKQAAAGAAMPQQQAMAPSAAQTAQTIDPSVANDPTLNQLASQLANNDKASAFNLSPASAPQAATLPTPSTAPSPTGNDAYIRQSNLSGMTSPFALPTSSKQPLSLDDIRHNPLAVQGAAAS